MILTRHQIDLIEKREVTEYYINKKFKSLIHKFQTLDYYIVDNISISVSEINTNVVLLKKIINYLKENDIIALSARNFVNVSYKNKIKNSSIDEIKTILEYTDICKPGTIWIKFKYLSLDGIKEQDIRSYILLTPILYAIRKGMVIPACSLSMRNIIGHNHKYKNIIYHDLYTVRNEIARKFNDNQVLYMRSHNDTVRRKLIEQYR